MSSHLSRPEARFLAYGLAGWAVDSLLVSIHTGRHRPSSLLNLPVYGLAQPLFEPVHDRTRQHPLVLRAAVYGAGILAAEYTSGRLLRRLVGRVPWGYSRARFGIDGLVRLDYLPHLSACWQRRSVDRSRVTGPQVVILASRGWVPAGSPLEPTRLVGSRRLLKVGGISSPCQTELRPE